MEYQATAKYLRNSPRKMRLVADGIRKLTPQEALLQLSRLPKRAAGPLQDVIASALSNARQKQAADPDKLKFKTIEVMEGPVMKRWHAVSRGMAHAYKKRMTHVRIVLTDDLNSKEK
jgi:large subunit ribosomal protein L22